VTRKREDHELPRESRGRVAPIGLLLCLSIAASAVALAGEEGSTTAPGRTGRTTWRELETQGFIAAGWARDSRSAEGIQIGYGCRTDADEGPGSLTFWLSEMTRGKQRITGLRSDLVVWPAWWSWGGVGPLLGAGFERRSHAPYEGLGGFLAIGVEVALWSRLHWHVTLDLEHDFGISAPARNQIRLGIAFADRRLWPGP